MVSKKIKLICALIAFVIFMAIQFVCIKSGEYLVALILFVFAMASLVRVMKYFNNFRRK